MSLGWTSRTISWTWHEKHGFTRVSLHLLAHLETAPKIGATVPTAIMKSSRSKTPAGYRGWGRSHYKDMYPRSEKLVNDHMNSQSCRIMFTYVQYCTIIYNKLYGGFLKQDNKEWLGTRQALGLATCLSLAKNACSWEKDWTNLPGERYMYIYIYCI